MKIYIIGFMGAGKTILCRELAKALSIGCYDLDEEIVRRAKLSINEIFNRYGENQFRKLESSILQEFQSEGIISTGGGAALLERNRKFMKENADHIIWLHTDWQVIWQRLKESPRPLVKGKTRDQVSEIYEQRLPIYRGLADIIHREGSLQNLIDKIQARQ
jgi:shikimate kinase